VYIRVAVDRAQAEVNRYAKESQEMLLRHQLDADALLSRIAELTRQAEELTAAIRAIDAELEALLAKILREAKIIATSLTKATISKQMDDQKFDAVLVDEASMAPMPSLYFAAGRATQKVIVVGDLARRAADVGIEKVGVISPYVDGVELASQAAKLINVSITRSKAQIVIVANVDYLASKLRPDSILIRVLEEFR
jgi:hypothetical protein